MSKKRREAVPPPAPEPMSAGEAMRLLDDTEERYPHPPVTGIALRRVVLDGVLSTPLGQRSELDGWPSPCPAGGLWLDGETVHAYLRTADGPWHIAFHLSKCRHVEPLL